MRSDTAVVLDGSSLCIEDLLSGCHSELTVRLGDHARASLERVRSHIEGYWMRDDAPLMYCFNTGAGVYKDVRVPVARLAEFQANLIRAHAAGVGPALPVKVVRAVMLLRANAFCTNYSGARPELVDRLLQFLNLGLHPVIPAQGSVGASGDLAPLAYVAGALCGMPEAQVDYGGERCSAREAAKRAGLSASFELVAKEASALLNGSTVSLAIAALAFADARALRRQADIAAALTAEALRGELSAFDARLHEARPHPGQGAVARNMRRILEGSRRCSEEARRVRFPDQAGDICEQRIQDVYSLRCVPQVHGPVSDALAYIERILTVEMNSATDNPLMFASESGFDVLSGGNFHGQYIAQACDLLAMAVADLAAMSERRLARLIDPAMSYGLPRNLNSGHAGLHTGWATVQCAMSALVMENRTLAGPGSVDTIPGKSNSEDHVANSMWCARKAAQIVANSTHVVACEMLMASQALALVEDVAREFPISPGSSAALVAIRAVAPPALVGDRWWSTDMNSIHALVTGGAVLNAVEREIGALE